MKKKVILIQPKIGYLDEVKRNPSIPLALLCVATNIYNDYEVEIFDQRLHPKWEEGLSRLLKDNPLCVGITSMTGRQLYYALEISKWIKSKSNCPIVWGGIHPTIDPQTVLENENIDIVVRGEGEETFYELVNCLAQGKDIQSIPSISFRNNQGEMVHNPRRPSINLNTLPEIPYHLVDLERYVGRYKERRSLYLQLSRGCPFSCAYCYNSVFNRSQWRSLTVEKALERISYLYHNYNIRYFDFIDDNLFTNPQRMNDIADKVIKNKWNIIWKGTLEIPSSKTMSDQFFKKMAEAGLERLEIGAESGSNRILKFINKHQTIEDVFELNKRLANFSFTPGYNFMIGLPTETSGDIKLTLKGVMKLLDNNPDAEINGVYCFTPYPGTFLYDCLGKFGFIPPSSLEEWSEFSGDQIKTPWLSLKQKKRLSYIQFASYFLNSKASNLLDVKKFIRILSRFYEPIARARFRLNFFGLMFEYWFLSLYKKLIAK